jgi:diguanylate cyclase (GGDEF)-like protein/PAS domain S-box-containing protein
MELPPGLFREALEKSTDAITITDAQLDAPGPRILYVNRAFETMTGYAREDVLGATPRILQGAKTEQAVLESLKTALRRGETFTGETYQYCREGTPFLVKWSVYPMRDDSDVVTHYLGVQRDVTFRRERRRRQKQLEAVSRIQREVAQGGLDLQRVREKMVQTALDITNADAAVVLEVEGRELVYRAVAGSAADSLDLRLPVDESISGLSYRLREVLLCEDSRFDERVKLKERAQRIGFLSGVLAPLVHEHRCYGVLKVYSATPRAFGEEDCQLLELASGVLASALFNATVFDLEVSRRSLLVDAIPILVSYIDRDRRYQEVNAAYEKWFGFAASDLRGKYLWEVLGDQAYETFRPHLDAALAGNAVSYEARVPYASGEQTIHAQYEPHFRRNGEVAGVYAVVRDITTVKQAEVDFLTNSFNRRKFEELAQGLLKSAARYNQAVTLVLMDVDGFKALNDRFGHLEGDEVLKAIARRVVSTLRDADTLARWGGEEFAILAPETDLEQGIQLADRVRAAIGDEPFNNVGVVTASLGVAQWRQGEDLLSLQGRADRALYSAKDQGRNRVVADWEYN